MEPDALAASPVAQFAIWMQDARAAGFPDPEAMALATTDASGRPSVRMVLLRGFGEDGFRFFTNLGSRKAVDLDANPVAAAVFHWDPPGRQVRLEGPVERLSPEEEDAYFATRARESRLGAWASPQSRPLPDRATLLQAVEDVSRRFPGDVPRPPHWGGYRLLPRTFEFWVQGAFRLHDRFVYEPGPAGWRITRLAP